VLVVVLTLSLGSIIKKGVETVGPQITKTEMKLDGIIESRFAEMSPPDTTHFVQWDLGFTRQDRELYGRRWKRQEARLLNFLDSGQPLTVSAEGKSYELPAIRIRGWKKRFRKIC